MARRPFEETALAYAYAGLGVLPVSVVLDHVRSMYNVGAFFRTADGARVERLYLCGITAKPTSGRRQDCLGAEASVAWEDYYDALVPLRMRAGAARPDRGRWETSDEAEDLFD